MTVDNWKKNSTSFVMTSLLLGFMLFYSSKPSTMHYHVTYGQDSSESDSHANYIDLADILILNRQHAKNIVMVDVRNKEAYAFGHISKAITLDEAETEAKDSKNAFAVGERSAVRRKLTHVSATFCGFRRWPLLPHAAQGVSYARHGA